MLLIQIARVARDLAAHMDLARLVSSDREVTALFHVYQFLKALAVARHSSRGGPLSGTPTCLPCLLFDALALPIPLVLMASCYN